MRYYKDVVNCTQTFLEGICQEYYRAGKYKILLHGHPSVIEMVTYWEKWRLSYEPDGKKKGLHRVTYMSNCGVQVVLVMRFEEPFDGKDIIGIVEND